MLRKTTKKHLSLPDKLKLYTDKYKCMQCNAHVIRKLQQAQTTLTLAHQDNNHLLAKD